MSGADYCLKSLLRQGLIAKFAGGRLGNCSAEWEKVKLERLSRLSGQEIRYIHPKAHFAGLSGHSDVIPAKWGLLE
jgi:hypothetical protein